MKHLLCSIVILIFSAPVAFSGAHNLHLPTLPTLDTYRHEPSPGFRALRNRVLNPQRPRRTLKIPTVQQPLRQRARRWTGGGGVTQPPTFEMPQAGFAQPSVRTFKPTLPSVPRRSIRRQPEILMTPTPPSIPTWQPTTPLPLTPDPTSRQRDWRNLVNDVLQEAQPHMPKWKVREMERGDRTMEKNRWAVCAQYNRFCANMLRSLGE